MLHFIDGKYYIYRDRKYIEVDVQLMNNELNITPKKDSIIEDNNVKSKMVSLDDIIKKLSKQNSLISSDSDNKRRYNR